MSEETNEAAVELFAVPTTNQTLPLVFGSPRRYVQAAGVIEQTGIYVSKMGFAACGVVMTARSEQAEGGRVVESLQGAGITAEVSLFGGECSFEEIERHASFLRESGAALDCLIAIGGGKVVDAGKSIAHRLDVPVVIIPSLASNDAPCSAASVIYTPEGVSESFEVFAENPALVLVDTAVVAAAPARFLVAGMADAMATWYEARACAQNPNAVTAFGASPTLAGTAIAELCAKVVYADGQGALEELTAGTAGKQLENIVEANTLLSGVGFECGGLAASHGVAQAYTVIPSVHENFLHGEMVAMGIQTQLALENWDSEADRCAEFFNDIGLPVTLAQLGLSRDDTESLGSIVEAALAFPFMPNMPFEVTGESMMAAILAADSRGRALVARQGDAAFKLLHD